MNMRMWIGFIFLILFKRMNGDWGLGIGDWGLGIGDWLVMILVT
jgi:hypothetical protein